MLTREQVTERLTKGNPSSVMRRVYERILAGQCVECGDIPHDGKRRCRRCNDRNKERVERATIKRIMMEGKAVQ